MRIGGVEKESRNAGATVGTRAKIAVKDDAPSGGREAKGSRGEKRTGS